MFYGHFCAHGMLSGPERERERDRDRDRERERENEIEIMREGKREREI